MWAAILEGVTRFSQMLDAIVERDDAGDLFAHLRAAFATELMGAFGKGRRREVAQNLPFRARFADSARDFRAHNPCWEI